MTPIQDALLAEIGFWKKLIATRRQSVTAETLARMEQALQLAEFRLGTLLDEPADQHVCH